MYTVRYVVVNALEEYLYTYKGNFRWVEDLNKATMWQGLGGAKLAANGKGSKWIRKISFNPTIIEEIRYRSA